MSRIVEWIDGARVVRDLTAEEIAAAAAAAEAAAEGIADAVMAELDRPGTIIHSLGVEVWQLVKAAEPELSAAEFKARVRARVRGA